MPYATTPNLPLQHARKPLRALGILGVPQAPVLRHPVVVHQSGATAHQLHGVHGRLVDVLGQGVRAAAAGLLLLLLLFLGSALRLEQRLVRLADAQLLAELLVPVLLIAQHSARLDLGGLDGSAGGAGLCGRWEEEDSGAWCE